MAQTCNRCGTLANDDAYFCPHCSNRLAGPSYAVPIAEPARRSRLPFVLVTLGFCLVLGVAAAIFYIGVVQAQHATDDAIATYHNGSLLDSSHTVSGVLTLTDSSAVPEIDLAADDSCKGSGGYSDLDAGASVILKDETGTVIGSTSLNAGSGSAHSCVFAFSMPNVPDTAKFYVVTVSHRGDMSQSHDEMVANGWAYDLTIGS